MGAPCAQHHARISKWKVQAVLRWLVDELELPQYSSRAIAEEKFRYAIFNCTAIDGDDDETGRRNAAMGFEDL